MIVWEKLNVYFFFVIIRTMSDGLIIHAFFYIILAYIASAKLNCLRWVGPVHPLLVVHHFYEGTVQVVYVIEKMEEN